MLRSSGHWIQADEEPEIIYPASPRSHSDATISQQRFDAACRAAAELVRAGHIVYCPVAHSHPLALHGLPTDWAYWERCDRRFLVVCDEVVVLTVEGQRDSVGVRAEIFVGGRVGEAGDVLGAGLRARAGDGAVFRGDAILVFVGVTALAALRRRKTLNHNTRPPRGFVGWCSADMRRNTAAGPNGTSSRKRLTCRYFSHSFTAVTTGRYAAGVASVTNYDGASPAAELHGSVDHRHL